MRVCTYKPMCAHVRVQILVQVKCQGQVIPQSIIVHFFFLRQCLSSNLELTNLARLANHRAPGIFLLSNKITSIFFLFKKRKC